MILRGPYVRACEVRAAASRLHREVTHAGVSGPGIMEVLPEIAETLGLLRAALDAIDSKLNPDDPRRAQLVGEIAMWAGYYQKS